MMSGRAVSFSPRIAWSMNGEFEQRHVEIPDATEGEDPSA